MTRYSISLLTAICSLFLVAAPVASAQDVKTHPATQVVFQYLKHATSQEWKESVVLLDADSVLDLMRRYVYRIKQAPTIDDEIAMVRKLNQTSLSAVEKMDPVDFYIAYHKGVQERFEVTDEILEQIKTTMRAKPLSLGLETIDGLEYAHVLVRTRHQNRDKEVSSLDLVSLVNLKGSWKVTLLAGRPIIKEIKK